jgi:hypothetical protein
LPLLTKLTIDLLKKLYFLVACITLSLNAFSQVNFYKFSIGAGAGLTRPYADLNRIRNSMAVYGTADYYLSPFTTLGLEGQVGHMKGGDKDVGSKRYFNNAYMSGSVNVKVHLGAFIDKGFRNGPFREVLNGLYAGTGIGILRNKVSETYHREEKDGTRYAYDQGRDRSKDAFVTFNGGIDYAIKDYHGWDRLLINANLQGNLTFGEGLDGYDDSPIYTHNQFADVYFFPSLGIKYKFGFVGYHKK